MVGKGGRGRGCDREGEEGTGWARGIGRACLRGGRGREEQRVVRGAEGEGKCGSQSREEERRCSWEGCLVGKGVMKRGGVLGRGGS